nr:hypothetical protein CFP56_04424 [Quercus suber]
MRQLVWFVVRRRCLKQLEGQINGRRSRDGRGVPLSDSKASRGGGERAAYMGLALVRKSRVSTMSYHRPSHTKVCSYGIPTHSHRSPVPMRLRIPGLCRLAFAPDDRVEQRRAARPCHDTMTTI